MFLNFSTYFELTAAGNHKRM